MTQTRALALTLLGASALPLLLATPAQAAPSAPTFSNGRVTPTSVSATVAFNARDGVDRLRWTRTAPGQPTVEVETRNRTSLTGTGLVTGVTYTFSVRTVDVDGLESPAATFRAVPTKAPSLGLVGPASTTGATASFPVQLAAEGNAASTRYDVQWMELDPNSYSYYRQWADDTTAPSLVFGGDNDADGVQPTVGEQGATYVFQGTAVDAYGNRGQSATSARRTVPLDQNRAGYVGRVSTVARPGSYGGSAAVLGGAGATAAITLRGDQVQVIGERCPSCGAVDVILNGKVAVRVDTVAATRSTRQVLFSRAFPTERTVKLALRAVGTAGRPGVVVDGFNGVRWTGAASRGGISSSGGLYSSCCPLYSAPRTATSARMTMQADGNLVVRSGAGQVLFQTRTGKNPGAFLVVQNDGNMVVKTQKKVLWQSGTRAAGGVFLIMQNDGNAVLFAKTDGRVLWSSRTGKLA